MILGIFESFNRPLLGFRRLALGAGLLLGSLTASSRAYAETDLTLGIDYESYFAKKEFLYGEEHYLNLSARLRTYTASEQWRTGFDLGGVGTVNVENYFSPFVPEAFVQFRTAGESTLRFELTAGRKREAWSRLDSVWKLGLFEPLFRWDYLHPQEQGLTGVFFALQAERARFMLFVTDIFVPEQGAPTRIENEKVTSPSPWFSEPANEAILLSVATDIRYKLNMPELKDIVFNPGIGSRFSAGDPSSGFWGNGSAAYKPRNRISIPVTTDVPLTIISVNIYPQIEYHALAAFDIGYAGSETSVSFSTLFEYPVNKKLDSELNRQKYDPTLFVMPMIEQKFSSRLVGSAALLHQDGGEFTEEGPISSTSTGSLFGYRYDWTNALMLGLNAVFRDTETNRLEGSARWIEEFNQRGSLVSVEMRYLPYRPLTFALSGDFLGSRADIDDGSGLINKYRGNDRFMGGMTYAF